MDINQKVIYEYNETDGNYHENLGDSVENTKGYKTVCHTTYAELDRFKLVRNAAFKDKPTFDEVKGLWDAWKASLSD